jgi:heme/copper-type cytochrome/quinol oxidase subunit 2
MPIEIKAVSKQEFEQWVGQMQAQQGITPNDQPQLADAEAQAN